MQEQLWLGNGVEGITVKVNVIILIPFHPYSCSVYSKSLTGIADSMIKIIFVPKLYCLEYCMVSVLVHNHDYFIKNWTTTSNNTHVYMQYGKTIKFKISFPRDQCLIPINERCILIVWKDTPSWALHSWCHCRGE